MHVTISFFNSIHDWAFATITSHSLLFGNIPVCLHMSLYVLMPNAFYICPFIVSTIMTAHSYVWILVNIEQIQFLHAVILLHLHWHFSREGLQECYRPLDGVCSDDSCGKVFGFTFHSKEITNDKSCCDKHRSTRVNWLIYVLIFFMSAETSLYESCVLAHQHAHKLSSLVKSRLHVHSQASI